MLPELKWEKRPFEIRNYLNPAFCATLLHCAVRAYEKEAGRNMSYPLVFLILPLILPKKISDNLPKRIDANFSEWVNKNSLIFLNFEKTIHFFNSYTKEAIIFTMQFNYFEIENGCIISKGNLRKLSWDKETELFHCYENAEFIGRWFVYAGSEVIIFKSLGICL